MDPANCSAGWVTDNLFIPYNPASPSCDVPIAAVATIFPLLSFFRVLVMFAQWRVWFKREQRRKENKRKTEAIGKRRLPFVPFLSVCACISSIIFTTLTLTNTINYENGFSCIAFASCYLPLTLTTYFFILRVVRLGLRMARYPNLVDFPKEQARALEKFDNFLFVFVGGYFLMSIIFFLCSLIAIFVERNLVLRLMFLFIGVSFSFGMISMVWQLHRIIKCINDQRYNGVSDTFLDLAIKRLRSQQLLNLVFGIIGSTLGYILSARQDFAVWWVIAIFLIIDLLVPVWMLISLSSRKGKGPLAKQSPTNPHIAPNQIIASPEPAVSIPSDSISGGGNT